MPRTHTDVQDCSQADKIEGIERELGDLNTAVFRGNGKPSLVIQPRGVFERRGYG